MANPLAALGRALVGGGDGGSQAKDLWEAVRQDDAGAVAHFLSRGSDVNERGPVRSFYRPCGSSKPQPIVMNSKNMFACVVCALFAAGWRLGAARARDAWRAGT